MKNSPKNLKQAILIVAAILINFCLQAGNDISKDEALSEIRAIKKSKSYNTFALKKIEKYAQSASCNYENFVLYAKKVSTVGFHTKMYMTLAKETSKLDEENPLLLEVAEIVEISSMGIDRFETILDSAIQAKTPEEKNRVSESIRAIKTEMEHL